MNVALLLFSALSSFPVVNTLRLLIGSGNSTLCAGELLKGSDASKDTAKKPRLLDRT